MGGFFNSYLTIVICHCHLSLSFVIVIPLFSMENDYCQITNDKYLASLLRRQAAIDDQHLAGDVAG